MIRGAIEIAQKNRVVGWIYSGSESLKGKTVLAFVGGRCVGSGEVDGFRQDLLDARLGDGYCGFDFQIKLAEGELVGSLIVRLQFSDGALLQQSSRVFGAREAGRMGPDGDLGALQPGRVAWLMDRGMLSQMEIDFLKALHTVGVHVRSLRLGKPSGGEAAIQRIAPEEAAYDLLGLVMMAEPSIDRTSVAALADIPAPTDSSAPVIALWSQDRGRISLDERSHISASRNEAATILSEPPPGGIDYGYGPDRLLFIHRDCRFAATGPTPARGLVVFTASPLTTTTAEIVQHKRVA